ncbi:putative adenylyltransferase/sulfurtransferase MoeZ [bioreactor metagenome]|uniref:Putative adenylyltransferase/sulfurtransferase MoeZ n=1 Tax=bioreactor metagenome TaxID=1076179 RepID=A0A644Y0X1_9ZZZZ
MKKRYSRNISTLTPEENEKLKYFKVCIVGCGGLGGYIIEMLARIGIGNLTVVDMDVFDESNLNRQILSCENNLGDSKVFEALKRINSINSDVKVSVVEDGFNEKNGIDVIRNHNVVVDALDNIESRLLLQEYCNKLNIPLVHGAIAGWFGQVCTIMPGDNTLNRIYKNNSVGVEKKLGNPSFTPANIASIQVSQVIKVLLSKGEILQNQMLVVDLLYNEFNIISLEE